MLSPSVLALSGGWSAKGAVTATYHPAQPATTDRASVPGQILVALGDTDGQNAGEFLHLTCNVAPGTVTDATSFKVTQVKAVDASGVTIPGVTVSVALQMDLTPPALLISTLSDHAVIRNPTLNITGNASDSGGISYLAVNETAVPINNDGSFSAALPLKGGANTVTVVARDGAGNVTSETRSITLDRTVPTITVASPADNGTVSGNSVTVAGSADESCSVEVRANGVPAQNVVRNGATFTATVNLTAGLNTIEIVVTHPNGTKSYVKRTIISNTSGPAVLLTSPVEDLVVSGKKVTIEGGVQDGNGAVTVSVQVARTTYTPQVIDGAFSQQITLPAEQAYPVVVIATDDAGRQSSVQRNIIYKWAPTGDLDGDGNVTIADALLALQMAVGSRTPTDAQSREGDVGPLGDDGRPVPDGVIDISDAVIILEKTVGLVNW